MKELPEGWRWVKLIDVAEIIMGQSPPGDTYNNISQGMPFLQGKAEFGPISPKHIKFTTKPLKKASKGSILISVRAPVGDVNIADIDYCIGRGLATISLNKGENLYLFYFLRCIKNKLKEEGAGSTFKAINKSILENLKIPIPFKNGKPDLEKQQKIVSILEKAEQTKRLQAEADELIDQFLKSTFLEMFGDPVKNPKGWDVVNLQELYSNERLGSKCGPFGSALKKHEYTSIGIPVWVMDNIQDMRFVEYGCLHISEEKYQELESYSVKNGDIIISRVGTVGKMCVVETDKTQSIISSNLIRLSFNDSKINPLYFVCLMTFCKGRVGRLKTGADGAYTFMNTKILDRLSIPFPPIELQNQFAQIVEKVEKTREYQNHIREEIEGLFNALMQKAFTGELLA